MFNEYFLNFINISEGGGITIVIIAAAAVQ